MTTTLPEGGPASAEDRDRLDAFLAARRRGVDWLLARLRRTVRWAIRPTGTRPIERCGHSGWPARSRPPIASPAGIAATRSWPMAGSAARSAPSSTAGATATRR